MVWWIVAASLLAGVVVPVLAFVCLAVSVQKHLDRRDWR